MCFYISNNITPTEIKESFGAAYKGAPYKTSGFLNGFTFPQTPVILNKDPGEAICGEWGLIPVWARNRDLQKATLNARIETLSSKISFKTLTHQRCLVLVNGFYEWQWLDPKGKTKQKFFIHLQNGNLPFALGGIYSFWEDPSTQEKLTTFSIVTTTANSLMAEIHNTRHRMPLVLTKDVEQHWLFDNDFSAFAFPHWNPPLAAMAL